MNSAEVNSTGAVASRPWNADTAYEFKLPTTGVYSSRSGAERAQQPRVKLQIDARALEAKRVLEEDENELGPVSESVLEEIRASWPV